MGARKSWNDDAWALNLLLLAISELGERYSPIDGITTGVLYHACAYELLFSVHESAFGIPQPARKVISSVDYFMCKEACALSSIRECHFNYRQ